MQHNLSLLRQVDPETLKQRIDSQEPVVLVEALPETYYQQKHLPGAINLPHDVSDEVISKVLPAKQAEIIVYCASGPCPNSGILAQRLVHLGYQNVSDFQRRDARVKSQYSIIWLPS